MRRRLGWAKMLLVEPRLSVKIAIRRVSPIRARFRLLSATSWTRAPSVSMPVLGERVSDSCLGRATALQCRQTGSHLADLLRGEVYRNRVHCHILPRPLREHFQLMDGIVLMFAGEWWDRACSPAPSARDRSCRWAHPDLAGETGVVFSGPSYSIVQLVSRSEFIIIHQQGRAANIGARSEGG
jgi:hypothetical protein